MEQEEKVITEGSLERLEAQVNEYLKASPDAMFVDYLYKLLERIRGQKHQVLLLQQELERSHQMFLNRQRLTEGTQPPQNKYVEMPLAQEKSEPVGQFSQQNLHHEEGEELQQQENPQYMDWRELQQPQRPVKEKRDGAEFMVGTAILGVVGGAFVLIGLVMLGMHFMNGFAKGMCMYAGVLALLLVSELILYKRWNKLATVFSSIGIGGLYISTLVNYLGLENFNLLANVLVTLFITLFAILLSRSRNAFSYRILGLLGCCLCLMATEMEMGMVEWLILVCVILVVNVACILMPIKKYRTAFHVIQLWANLVVSWWTACFMAPEHGEALPVMAVVLVMQLILYAQMRWEKREKERGRLVNSLPVKISYFACGAGYSFMLGAFFEDLLQINAGLFYGAVAGLVILCMAAVVGLRHYNVKWYPYYLMNLFCLNIFIEIDNTWAYMICLVVLLGIAKLLSLWRISQLKLSDAVLTTLTCIALLGSIEGEKGYELLLLVGVLVSVFFISQWQTYFEVLLVFTLGIYTAAYLDVMLKLPVFVGILFVGILLFNNVSRFRGRSIIAFNGLAVAGGIICFLMLMSPTYQETYITYFFMLIFGLATIVLTFQEKYHMNFKYKNLIMSFFLTYMAIILHTGIPIINSILLMLIALISVGIGFSVKEKAVRIYGLVLSLLVCVKIVLYDYMEVPTLQKTILFFSVGVIALIISGIYIILEKKSNKN